MTRSRQPRPAQPPLADTLRAALAQGWHTLDALESLAGRATGARLRVHAALGELRAGGCTLEERVERGVAEVRLAPVEVASDGAAYSDGIPPLSPEATAAFLDLVEHPPAPTEALRALMAGDAAPVADEPAAPVEGARRVSVLAAHLAHYGHIEEAREIEGLPPAAREPGPSSRCALCEVPFARHGQHPDDGEGHPFQPKPRGRPPTTPSKQPPIPNAAPAILPRGRQRRERGPVVDVDGGRVERLAAAQAADPDVEELPSAGEQRAILDGAKRDYDAAVEDARTERDGFTSDTLDAIREVIETAPVGAEPPPRCPSVWHGEKCEREAGHPCEDGRHHESANKDAIWTDDAAARWAREEAETTRGGSRGKRAPAAPPAKPPRCRPPLCHADDIHEPSRVRAFARPLCERHRAWVEGAGGTLAAGGLAGILPTD